MTTGFTPAKKEVVSEPLPLENDKSCNSNRIWIGNLDSGINEYNLLQVLKTVGRFKDLDYMYHRTGALQGQCRGFSFVTYHTKQEAQHAIDVLNGTQVLSRRISARWAHEQPVLPTKLTPTNINLSTNLATTASNITSPNSRNSMINSIEKKLLTMQNNDSAETTSTLHPALQKAKLNMAAAAAARERARKRNFPYKKSNSKRR